MLQNPNPNVIEVGQKLWIPDEAEAAQFFEEFATERAAASSVGSADITGELNVLLANPTGHGLAAVISALPMIDVFYTMCEKGFSLASIVRELNRKAHYLLPADRFLAVAVLSASLTHAATSEQRSTQADQESIAVTIYNEDLALVKEVRRVTLADGAAVTRRRFIQ